MDDRIMNTAREIVYSLVPDEDGDDEIDAQNAEFMSRAIPMMKKALDEWRAEHPGKHCDIHAVRDDDGTMHVVITPKE